MAIQDAINSNNNRIQDLQNKIAEMQAEIEALQQLNETMASMVPAAPAAPAEKSSTKDFFLHIAAEAVDWDGVPCLDDLTPAEKGYVCNMKKQGLIETHKVDGCLWAYFTDEGRALAAENGIEIPAE